MALNVNQTGRPSESSTDRMKRMQAGQNRTPPATGSDVVNAQTPVRGKFMNTGYDFGRDRERTPYQDPTPNPASADAPYLDAAAHPGQYYNYATGRWEGNAVSSDPGNTGSTAPPGTPVTSGVGSGQPTPAPTTTTAPPDTTNVSRPTSTTNATVPSRGRTPVPQPDDPLAVGQQYVDWDAQGAFGQDMNPHGVGTYSNRSEGGRTTSANAAASGRSREQIAADFRAAAGLDNRGTLNPETKRYESGPNNTVPGTEGVARPMLENIYKQIEDLGGDDWSKYFDEGAQGMRGGIGSLNRTNANIQAMLDAGYTPDQVSAMMISGGGNVSAERVSTQDVLNRMRGDYRNIQGHLQGVMGGRDALFNANRAQGMKDLQSEQEDERNRMLGEMNASGMAGSALGVGAARQSEESYQDAVARAELEWAEADRQARLQAAGLSTNATGMMGGLENTQASRKLLAATENQQAALDAAKANQENTRLIQEANQKAKLEADQANQDAGLTARGQNVDLINAQAGVGRGLVDAGAGMAGIGSSLASNRAANLNATTNALTGAAGAEATTNQQRMSAQDQEFAQSEAVKKWTQLTASEKAALDQQRRTQDQETWITSLTALLGLEGLDDDKRDEIVNRVIADLDAGDY